MKKLLILLSALYLSCSGSSEKSEIIKLENKHCAVVFDSLDPFFREPILTEFAKYSKLQKSAKGENVSQIAQTLLNSAIRYPKTLKIDGSDNAYVYLNDRDLIAMDRDKGTLTFSQTFTSENKLGMKVKGQYWLKVKYTAGCKPFEVLDFQIE
jgi:hypothetical protein